MTQGDKEGKWYTFLKTCYTRQFSQTSIHKNGKQIREVDGLPQHEIILMK